jgi:hypothetical protein
MALTITNVPDVDKIYLSGDKFYIRATSTLSGNDNFAYKVEVLATPVGSTFGDPITLLVPPVGSDGSLEIDLSSLYNSFDYGKFTTPLNFSQGSVLRGVYQSIINITEVTPSGSTTQLDVFYFVDGNSELSKLAALDFYRHYVANVNAPDEVWLTDAPSLIKSNQVQLEFVTQEDLIDNYSFSPFSPYTNITDYDGQFDESDLSNAEFFSNDIAGFFTMETSANGRGDFNSQGYSKIAYLPFTTIAYAAGFGDQILNITFEGPNPILDTINFPDFTGYRLLLVGANIFKTTWTVIDELFVDDGGTPSQLYSVTSASVPINLTTGFYYLGVIMVARDIADNPTDNPFPIEFDSITVEIEREAEYFVKYDTPSVGLPVQYTRFGNSRKRNFIELETSTALTYLTVVDTTFTPLSRTIAVQQPCQKLRRADAVVIQFQNDYASTEYCTLYELESSLNTGRVNIIKPLPSNFTYQDRGSATINSNTSTSRAFVSDFLTESEANWLVQLIRSTSVGILQEDAAGDPYILPVIITTSEITKMNESLTPLYQLRVEMVEANTLSLR